MTDGGGCGGDRYHHHHEGSRVPQLDTCCCILPLPLGVKLIALSELLVCSGLFLYTLIEVVQGPSPFSTVPSGDVIYLHYTALVDVIFALYLLVGVYFRKPHYAKIWSAAQVIHLFVSTVITIYRTMLVEMTKSEYIKQLTEFTLTTCLDAYFILVVYSYYREQKKKCLDQRLPPGHIP